MTRLIRTFHPVGQGAFYTERFVVDEDDRSKDINVVYDCGSWNKAALRRAIDAEFKRGETIHAVFISHFHCDHINGLEYLRERCKILRLFFPDVAKEIRLCHLMDCLCAANGRNTFEYNFINEPSTINAFNDRKEKGGIQLYEVQIANIDDNLPERYERITGRYGENELEYRGGEICKVKSGTDIASACRLGINDWVYIPFNLPHDKQLQRVREMLGGRTCEDLREIVKNGGEEYEKFKKEYCEEFHSNRLNETSMTVYSGCANSNCRVCAHKCHGLPILDFHYPHIVWYGVMSPGCLFTGDYPAKSDSNLKKLIEAYPMLKHKECLGYLQLPHHGAINGFNSEFLNWKNVVFIISAGNENIYGHPSSRVLEQLIGHPYVIVSECLHSMLIIWFIR